MAVYRFRVTFEENEDVYREIEIKSTQHFEDFHFSILQSIGFDTKHNASFFVSDDYWRKGEEIFLKPDEAEERKRQRNGLPPAKLMNKCKMASLIDDPHQKFVYVYDPNALWTLMVELVKILPDDKKVVYPKVVKTTDSAPKQYVTNDIIPSVESPVDDFDEDEEISDDEEAYADTAVEEDDVKSLEGEEGDPDEEVMDDDSEITDLEDTAGEGFEED